MKKCVLLICALIIAAPNCLAKTNYDYTTLPNGTVITSIPQTGRVEENVYSNSSTSYSLKGSKNTPVINETQNREDVTVQGEKITQVGSKLYYDSGKKSSWHDTAKITGAAAAIGTVMALDPYIVNINGNKYIILRDLNNKTFVKQNIVGLNDTYENIFDSLKAFDSDKNGIITGKELKDSGIRLSKIVDDTIYFNDSSKDFNVLKIKSIPLNSMKSQIPDYVKVENRNSQIQVNRPGIYGTFDVNLSNNTTSSGQVEFLSKLTINNMVKRNK